MKLNFQSFITLVEFFKYFYWLQKLFKKPHVRCQLQGFMQKKDGKKKSKIIAISRRYSMIERASPVLLTTTTTPEGSFAYFLYSADNFTSNLCAGRSMTQISQRTVKNSLKGLSAIREARLSGARPNSRFETAWGIFIIFSCARLFR